MNAASPAKTKHPRAKNEMRPFRCPPRTSKVILISSKKKVRGRGREGETHLMVVNPKERPHKDERPRHVPLLALQRVAPRRDRQKS